MNDLSDTEKSSKEKFGLKSPKALRMVRQAIESGDEGEIERMRKIAPKAVAAGLAGKAAREKMEASAPKGLIGLGKGVPNSGGVSGVSASTSLVSTGDLFTMMQAGGTAKKETELAELQGINTRLDKIIELSGGVK